MKRMIDNKEFENIKNDISELQEEIKSIEGIPTITISLSQMLSETTAQLTDEQYEILENNNFINFIDPNGNKYSMSLYQDSTNHSSLFYSSGLMDDSSYVGYYQVGITKATKVAVFGLTNIPRAKQLYQHNIRFNYGGGTNIEALIEIIIEDGEPIAYNNLFNYLMEKFPQKTIKISGIYQNSFLWKAIPRNNTTLRVYYLPTLTDYQDWIYSNVLSDYYEDDVKPL